MPAASSDSLAGRKPAVSVSSIGQPSIAAAADTMSRVVPAAG